MHILLVHQVFLPTDQPGITQHYEYARYLVQAGHRVTVLAGTRSYFTGSQASSRKHETLEPGLEVLRCSVWSSVHRSFLHRTIGFLSFMLSSLWRGLGVRHVDLVWSSSPPLPQICTAWVLAWLKRVPHVFEVRDLWPSVAIELGVLRNRFLIALARGAERFLYRHSKRVLVNSPGFIPYLRQAGVPEAKIALVPNGVDTTRYDPRASGEPFRLAHGLQGKFVALYAGAHGLSNDLTTVLQAADRLRHDPRLVFVLVGDGKEKPGLMRQAEQMDLENACFLPPAAKTEMPGVLAAADCGIAILKAIPLFATTYPNKVFDYMAAGRPVVLAIEGVIRDVVEEAGAGLAIPPGDPEALADAVLSLAADPDRARQMGRQGRACVEQRFDRRLLARQLESVLLDAARR